MVNVPSIILPSLLRRERFCSDTIALTFGYDRQLCWMEACMKQVDKLGCFNVLAYDRGIYPIKVMSYVDVFVQKPRGSSGVVHSWFWHTYFTLHLVEQYEFVFSISADCYISKPEGFTKLKELLGDNDFICYWYDDNRIGTMCILWRREAYIRATEYIISNWNRNHVEASTMTAVKELGLKYTKHMEKMFHFVLLPDDDPIDKRGRGLFGEVIGLRHLQMEHFRRKQLGMLSLEAELVDLTYS
jgi:hypothetical protein